MSDPEPGDLARDPAAVREISRLPVRGVVFAVMLFLATAVAAASLGTPNFTHAVAVERAPFADLSKSGRVAHSSVLPIPLEPVRGQCRVSLR